MDLVPVVVCGIVLVLGEASILLLLSHLVSISWECDDTVLLKVMLVAYKLS